MLYICRAATSKDFEKIQKIFLAVAKVTLNRSMFNWSEHSIAEEIQLSQFYILESSGPLIQAFIAYRETDEVCEILALGTSPDSLNQGLMFGLLSSFVQKNSKSIHLEVHAQNKSAIGLYEKCGFTALRIRKSYYKDGADAVVMHFESQA
jgi:[ribosomal protein S18]-alanine N-acetyltransferase